MFTFAASTTDLLVKLIPDSRFFQICGRLSERFGIRTLTPPPPPPPFHVYAFDIVVRKRAQANTPEQTNEERKRASERASDFIVSQNRSDMCAMADDELIGNRTRAGLSKTPTTIQSDRITLQGAVQSCFGNRLRRIRVNKTLSNY